MLQQALEDKKHLQILETKEWKIPIHSYTLKVTAATKKKLDILKKVVMHTILNMNITSVDELSSCLNVDPLFIRDIIGQMLTTGLVERQHRDEPYMLTDVGREQYRAGTILSEPVIELISFEYSPLHEEVITSEPINVLMQDDWEVEIYRYQAPDQSLHDQVLDEETVRQFVKRSGQVFEIGGNEKVISKIEPLELTKTTYAKCYEFQLYDLLENKVYARVWNGATSRWDERIEDELNQLESEEWKTTYEKAIIHQFPQRYDDLRRQLKEFNSKSKKKNSRIVDILRGKDIRTKFLTSFTETKRKMLMVSPWISSTVIDEEMITRLKQFAKQNKTLYISWGIAKNLESEDRKPSQTLLEKLTSIKHEDGTQAIFVRWFGNQHNKEIVIDSNTHLLGSYNWLSYRGDYDIRHESVVVMKDEKIIKDTTFYIESKFIAALETELTLLLEKENLVDSQMEIKNWVKELLLLDSSNEKRIMLSNELINHLYEQGKDDIVHEIANMWVRYDSEDFGVKNHLSKLLKQNEEERAKEYYQLCLKYIQTAQLWTNLQEFKEYKEWLSKQSTTNKSDEKVKSKKSKVKKKK